MIAPPRESRGFLASSESSFARIESRSEGILLQIGGRPAPARLEALAECGLVALDSIEPCAQREPHDLLEQSALPRPPHPNRRRPIPWARMGSR